MPTEPKNPPQDPPANPPNDPPKTKDVKIGEETFVLPTDVADKLIAQRDNMTQGYNAVNSERDQLKQQLEAIEAEKQKAIAEQEKQKALGNSDVENLQKIHAQELAEKEKKLEEAQRLNNEIRLSNIISVRDDIPAIARGDAAALIKAEVAEVIDSGGQLHFKKADGTLLAANAFVDQWLEAHPAFKSVNVPRGPGAKPDGGGNPPTDKPTITLAEYNKRMQTDPDLVMKVTKQEIRLIQ